MLEKTVAAIKADKTLDQINKGENGFLCNHPLRAAGEVDWEAERQYIRRREQPA
jgi:hypothetical protein